jgi:hypothetical protein
MLMLSGPGSARAGDEEGCLGCHGLPGFAVRDAGAARNLWLSPEAFELSAHGELGCRDCHGDITSIPHGQTREVSCGQACHGRAAGGKPYSHEGLYWEYAASSHGNARSPRIGCLVCHPRPARREDATRDKLGAARRCAACHRGNPQVLAWFLDRHAVALAAGNSRAPSCPDCHGAHGVRPEAAPESSVAAQRRTSTCANGALDASPKGGCHGGLAPTSAAGAAMNPLPVRGGSRRGLAAAFNILAALLLAGLVARAGVGFARGR